VLLDPPKKWGAGEKVDLVVLFGTPGVGPGTFAYPIQPFTPRPTAQIEFPAKDAGGPPALVKVALQPGARGDLGG
jgi:hypothetical protein